MPEMFYPRVLVITNQETARQELQKLGCDPQGVAIMTQKAIFKTIKLENVPTKAANLLKQTFLAKGGEVAVARGTADLSVPATDVIICATAKQFHVALRQLKAQPWGLPVLAESVEEVMRNDAAFPARQYTWKDHNLLLQNGHTLVMGILNVTPDSFSDGGRYHTVETAIKQAERLIEQGAEIIDLGAESTRPYGAVQIDSHIELNRLMPILEQLVHRSKVPISIDTYKASVAKAAIEAGAHIINDIWGLQHDPDMAAVVAEGKVPVIIMHNQEGTEYERDILSEMLRFLSKSIEIGLKAGIPFDRFIIDPGIGFGKTTQQNLEVMARLEELKSLGCPILVGTSRKRFIGESLGNLPVDDRVEGTAATVAWAIAHGAQIVRVHDVKEMARIAKMTDVLARRRKNDR